MVTFSQDEVLEILRIIAESDVEEFHLETGDLKLIAKKNIGTASVEKPEARKASVPVAEPLVEKTLLEESPGVQQADRAGPVASRITDQGGAPSPAPEDEGLIPIESPMLGTFYRAPEPGAPPFVEVGQMVTEDDDVCIIEVMKLFSTIKAGVRGRIARICVENAQMVEFKQVLFFVEECGEDKPREGHGA